MILKPCPFCHKKIPRAITACPYCHMDEKGQMVVMDSTLANQEGLDRTFDHDLQELGSEDPFVREQAVLRVSQRGPAVVQRLISLLTDFGKGGLSGVAKALGQIADRRAIPALAQAAKLGDDDLRLSAAWALAQFHDPEVLPVLLAEAERPHPIIQGFLAYVLGTFQDSRVVPVLSRLCAHTHREVAFQAACALGETGDANGIPALQQAWRRRDPFIRAASSASLRRLGGKPTLLSMRAILFAVVMVVGVGAGLAWIFYR